MQPGAGHAFDNHESEMFYNEAAAAVGVGADHGASSASHLPVGVTPASALRTQPNSPGGRWLAGPRRAA